METYITNNISYNQPQTSYNDYEVKQQTNYNNVWEMFDKVIELNQHINRPGSPLSICCDKIIYV